MHSHVNQATAMLGLVRDMLHFELVQENATIHRVAASKVSISRTVDRDFDAIDCSSIIRRPWFGWAILA